MPSLTVTLVCEETAGRSRCIQAEAFVIRIMTRVWFPGVVLHLVLAISNIGRRDLWYDEALSLAATKHLATTASHTGGNMVAYYGLLTPWSWISASPEWLRLPSLAATTVAIGVATILIDRQAGAAAARLSGVFIACSYIAVRYSSEARSYGLLALLVASAWLTLDKRLCGDAGRWTRIAYPATVVPLPLVHGLAVCQVAMMLAALAWARPPARLFRQLVLPCLAALVLAAGLWGTGGRDVANWIPPLSARNLGWFFRRLVAPYLILAAALLGMAAVGAWAMLRNPGRTAVDRFRQVSFVLWGPGAIALLLLLSLVRPYAMDRYAFPAAFGLAGSCPVRRCSALPSPCPMPAISRSHWSPRCSPWSRPASRSCGPQITPGRNLPPPSRRRCTQAIGSRSSPRTFGSRSKPHSLPRPHTRHHR